MPVRLRLARHGRKGRPYYYIVAADSRAPRDGKFLEKVGTYNPISDPAEIKVDHDKALKWLQNGAQPSTTVKSILRYAGVNLKMALIKQGKSEEEIERIYGKWVADKEARVQAKKEQIASNRTKAETEALAAEAKVREARAAAIAAKNAPPAPEPVEEEEAAPEAVEAEAAEAPEAVAEAEAPAAEAPAEETPAE